MQLQKTLGSTELSLWANLINSNGPMLIVWINQTSFHTAILHSLIHHIYPTTDLLLYEIIPLKMQQQTSLQRRLFPESYLSPPASMLMSVKVCLCMCVRTAGNGSCCFYLLSRYWTFYLLNIFTSVGISKHNINSLLKEWFPSYERAEVTSKENVLLTMEVGAHWWKLEIPLGK